MKTVLQIILAIVIIGSGYGLYRSIQTPIEFRRVKQQRYDATIKKLQNIREAQIAYKDEYENFTGSFDTLIDFVKNDSLRVVKATGRIPDELLEKGMTEQEALRKGIIERDTVRVSVKDSLFGPDYNADLLWKVPYTNDSFQLGARTVESGNVDVDVFEAKVHNDVLLHDQNEQLVINLNERMSKKQNKFPGVKVGDLNEPNNNAGNWE